MKKTFAIIKKILLLGPLVLPTCVFAQFYAVIPYYAPYAIPNTNPHTFGDHPKSFGNYAPNVIGSGNPQYIAASAAQSFPREANQTISGGGGGGGGGGYAQTASVGNAFPDSAVPKLPKTGGGGRALAAAKPSSGYGFLWILTVAFYIGYMIFKKYPKAQP